MKIFKLTYGLMAATMFSLASCDINDYPEFSDADAFAAFTSKTIGVGEADGTVEIPIMLTSQSGMTATVDVEVVPDSTGNDAVEGTHFTIENKTVSFSGLEGAKQSVKVKIVDNDIFTGNKSFTSQGRW